ncbi:MAG: nuclear transport factor 2 family protein [Acidimicrobiia bacterium]|nr:nuclear transport factor 2 family protein [Acidimicrobiia bacterium]
MGEDFAVTDSAAALARRFWELMATNDFGSVAEVLDPHVVVDWPLTRERIRGVDNFVRIQNEYPANGPWLFTIHRLFGDGPEAVSDVSVSDGVVHSRVISFFTVDGDRIAELREYWPDEYEPPDNRSHLVEPLDDSTTGS